MDSSKRFSRRRLDSTARLDRLPQEVSGSPSPFSSSSSSPAEEGEGEIDVETISGRCSNALDALPGFGPKKIEALRDLVSF
jgi:hypothetical protein